MHPPCAPLLLLLLLSSCLLLQQNFLVAGQGFRCPPDSQSRICIPLPLFSQPFVSVNFTFNLTFMTEDPDPSVEPEETAPPVPTLPPLQLPRFDPANLPELPDPVSCNSAFRNLDGSCTNLADPSFGATGNPQFSYVTGLSVNSTDISSTRQVINLPPSSSVIPNGANRPSARKVSNIVSDQGDIDMSNKRGLTLFFVFFGQLLDHDLVLTPFNPNDPFNIPVPPNDPFFANVTSSRGGGRRQPDSTKRRERRRKRRQRRRKGGRRRRRRSRRRSRGFTATSLSSGGGEVDGFPPPGTTELPFSRSRRASILFSNLTLERPMNAQSSPIDLSEVYGAEEDRLDALRETGSCKMLTSGADLLPLNNVGLENEPSPSATFFLAGDVRSNENPALTSLHTVFLREHNRLCDELAADIPFVSQDLLFQLARAMNIFQMQKIVYEEFLPAIMGSQINIGPFNRDVNPSVSDIFSTAAFRLGHTMVGETLPTGLLSPSELAPADTFFRDAATYTSIATPGQFLSGVVNTAAQEVDVRVVDSLRNFLFSNVPELMGFDLVALNLQRGRDHALPSYNTVRGLFGLPPLTRFAQVTSDISLQFRLRRAYANVDDMDLWIALLAEDHLEGASMGLTMFRIWEAEFRRLAEGDRFFYTNPTDVNNFLRDSFSRFSAIESSTTLMRDILVRNTQGVSFPETVFQQEKFRGAGSRKSKF